MTAAWICATPDASTGHDTEAQAEQYAAELVKGGRAKAAVVYRVEVDDEHAKVPTGRSEGPVGDEQGVRGSECHRAEEGAA